MNDEKPSEPPTGSCVGWEKDDPRFDALVRKSDVACSCTHCRTAREHARRS